jgi:hypothetical protein
LANISRDVTKLKKRYTKRPGSLVYPCTFLFGPAGPLNGALVCCVLGGGVLVVAGQVGQDV